MKNKRLLSALLFTFFFVASAHAESFTASNVSGVYEGVIVFPSPSTLGLETYIVHYDLKADGTLAYTEFHDNARTIGILGTTDYPACTGTYRIENGIIIIDTDCSHYSKVYSQEIDLSQTSVEELTSAEGKEVITKTTLYPGLETKVLLRKLQ